jgi:hypothetical protein
MITSASPQIGVYLGMPGLLGNLIQGPGENPDILTTHGVSASINAQEPKCPNSLCV